MPSGIEVASLFATIDLKDRSSSALKGVSGGLDTLGSKLKDIGGGMMQTGAALTLVTAPITAFLGASLQQASEQQAALTQLDAVIKSTGGAAGVTAKAAVDLSDSLSLVTRFSDDAVLGAENMLLTFTNIGSNVFPDATKTALDMSQALGQDLKSSSIQLGKALNDPIKGITALTRVGVTFTEAQKAQIKALVESGNVMGAQKVILAELSREFGGSAEAAGTTFGGKMDILTHRFTEFQEKIGFAIMPILSRLTDAISPIIDSISAWVDANPQLTQTLIEVAGAVAVAGPVLIALGAVITGIGTVVGLLASPLVLVAAGVAALALAFSTNFLGIRDTIQPVIDSVKSFVGMLQHGFSIGDSLKVALLNLLPPDAAAGVGNFVNKVQDALKGIWPNVQSDLQKVADWFTGTGPTSFGGGLATVGRVVDQYVIPPLKDAWTKVQPDLQHIADWFSGTGPDSFGGALATVIQFVHDNVVVPLEDIWTTVQPYLQSIADWFTGSGPNSFGGAVITVWTFVNDNVIVPLEQIWDTVKPYLQTIADWFTGTGPNSLGGALATVIGFVNDDIITPLKGIWDKVGPALNDFKTSIASIFQWISDHVLGPIATDIQHIVDAINSIKGQSGTLGKSDPNYNPFAGYTGAMGGVRTIGSDVLVGENGPEMVHFGATGRITPNNQLGGGDTYQITIMMPESALANSQAAQQRGQDFGTAFMQRVRAQG